MKNFSFGGIAALVLSLLVSALAITLTLQFFSGDVPTFSGEVKHFTLTGLIAELIGE